MGQSVSWMTMTVDGINMIFACVGELMNTGGKLVEIGVRGRLNAARRLFLRRRH